MKVVKISDAKVNLSRHLQFVRGGGRIRIVDRDTAVADLVPIEARARGEDEALLASIERRGVGHRGKGGAAPRELLRPGPKDPKASLAKALLEERRGAR